MLFRSVQNQTHLLLSEPSLKIESRLLYPNATQTHVLVSSKTSEWLSRRALFTQTYVLGIIEKTGRLILRGCL